MDDQYTEPEEQLDQQPDENSDEAVDIYSRRAILGFCIFFSTVFGGALLYRNLRNVGLKQAANTVLLFSIAYTLGSMLLVNSVRTFAFAPLFFNVGGGLILTNYYFPKYFPDDDYYPKPIWKPLTISLLICVVLVGLLYYTGQLPPLPAAKAK